MGACASELHSIIPCSCLEFVVARDIQAQKKKWFAKEYDSGPVLGEGSFGVVKSCTNRRTGEKFAVKMVKKKTAVKDAEREANMMQSVQHKNIIRFHGIYYGMHTACIVMDRYLGGDLIGWLECHEEGAKCQELVSVVQQITASIHYLHCNDIAHRDIKCDNYLLNTQFLTHPECRVVLTDFGAACCARPGDRFNEVVGTKVYWAPELYDGNYGRKVDIWAMGILVYSLVTGFFPFREEAEIKKRPARISSNVFKPCKMFIKSLLIKDEASRPSSEEIVNHEWIEPASYTCTSPQVASGNNGSTKVFTDDTDYMPNLLTPRSQQLCLSSSIKISDSPSADGALDSKNEDCSDELLVDKNKDGPNAPQIIHKDTNSVIKALGQDLVNRLEQGSLDKLKLHLHASEAVKRIMVQNVKAARNTRAFKHPGRLLGNINAKRPKQRSPYAPIVAFN